MSIKSWGVSNEWSLFLDRDGVINQRIFNGYVTRVEDFHFCKGAVESIASLSNIFSQTFVVTNQQGVGKKIMTECNLKEIHTYMCDSVVRLGGRIEKVYFASNLKDELPDNRKPLPVMALMAKSEYPSVDFEKSIMVGDTDSDILFGKNLGMKTIRVLSEEPIEVEADLNVSGLEELLKIIQNEIID